jgi:hypothetical protein
MLYALKEIRAPNNKNKILLNQMVYNGNENFANNDEKINQIKRLFDAVKRRNCSLQNSYLVRGIQTLKYVLEMSLKNSFTMQSMENKKELEINI